jgi:DNA ligase-1
MPDLSDEQSVQIKGSGSSVYTLKNSGGVYSCTCPAWRNQSLPIERRTCKHLRAYRGDAEEAARVGNPDLPIKASNPETDRDGPALLLAHKWETDVDITGWWLSEKLDGVRAYWDGKQFLSRLGNRFFPPDWFVEGFPEHPLDGELFGGRKQFQRTVGIVKRQDHSPLWKELSYVVFDAPVHPGPFEGRIEHARSLIGEGTPYARVHEHFPCEGLAHLKQELARVEALGGEGLMARKPGSLYEAGRSSSLLKIKSFKDAEARVVGHVAGAGKHKGRLGALVVELADETRFNVGTGFSDAERTSPPPLGAIITFRYQELSDGGVPRFPSFVGVRIDATEPSRLVVDRPATEEPAPDRLALAAVPVRHPPRRFEREEDGVRHFWTIEQVGASHRITSGTFEEEDDTFESELEAADALDMAIAEQVAIGFAEVGRSIVSKTPVVSTTAHEAAAPASSVPSKAVESETTSQPPGNARYFELVEGNSSKFWEVRIEGALLTTRYGRIGTSGQSSTKSFASDVLARKEHDKLVAEKCKKGYVEK